MAGQQRRDQIARGQGSGRMIPINRNRLNDEEDPLRDVRAEMPYNSLVDNIPDHSGNVYAVRYRSKTIRIPNIQAIKISVPYRTASHTQSHRERYYSRLQNLIINAFGVEYNAHRENMNSSSSNESPSGANRDDERRNREEGADPGGQHPVVNPQTSLLFGVSFEKKSNKSRGYRLIHSLF